MEDVEQVIAALGEQAAGTVRATLVSLARAADSPTYSKLAPAISYVSKGHATMLLQNHPNAEKRLQTLHELGLLDRRVADGIVYYRLTRAALAYALANPGGTP